MDFESIKSKVTKKHIIIGTSAIVLIAGGITAGVIANSSDEQAVNAPIAETQPTTEQVTTAVTTATTTTTKATTTTVVTTTTVKTTKKTEKKKEENKSDTKTEVKEESNTAYENDYSYDEPQYEEPAQQEAPKYEEPKQEAPAPAPEPEPEPEPVYDRSSPEFWGYTGHDAELFNYALSQGCSGDAAQGYVMRCNYCGESNVFIGNPAPEDPNSYWGIWWTPDGGETWSTW